jgi:SAM-dependent methyltransferase
MSKASDLQKATYEAHGNTTGFTSVPERVNKARKLFSALPPGKVLDVGCGDGFILKPLVGHHEVHGVDISEIAVGQANAAGVKAKKHDLEDPLPYENATFDAIFCGETIEHQVDTDWLLSEINRVLKPGGHLVLTYPNIRTPVGILMLTFLDMPPMYAARYRAPHYRDFTLRTVKLALRNNGFNLDKAWGCAFFIPGPGGGKERGFKLASFFPWFASTVILRAVKVADAKYRIEDVVSEIY